MRNKDVRDQNIYNESMYDSSMCSEKIYDADVECEKLEKEELILDVLREAAQKVEIPESIKPEQMRKKLEEHQSVLTTVDAEEEKMLPAIKKKKRLTYSKALAAAASICIVIGCAVMANRYGLSDNVQSREDVSVNDTEGCDTIADSYDVENAESSDSLSAKGINCAKLTYEDIYASMEEVWQEEEQRKFYYVKEDITNESAELEVGASESVAVDDAMPESVQDLQESDVSGNKSFASTNVQTVGVDEGDIVKNDGRYLYQIVENENRKQTIQIVDTLDGLEELTRLGEFESIEEFYVWENVLVVIENRYLDEYTTTKSSSVIACYDVIYHDNCYHQISVYDISDRSQPEELKTFTLQGRYMSSRVADGYFYGFSRYYANPGEGEADYDAYVPNLDGARLEANHILLPEDGNGTSYLVMVSIDLRNPMGFVQTTGIVSDSDMYYVSANNIYVTYANFDAEEEEGWSSDETTVLRFTYGDGEFSLAADGTIKGTLDDTFSLDEYDDHLRVVSTVREYNREMVNDDRTGEVIGLATVESRQTNALYILDENLTMTGSIEGLAEDEQIYSARFMGNTGYFVTFRQTDPLFAVDLTDPSDPKVLSELKVSGFSEYLHFYGEDQLFGFGMEADEETGRQEGMKLSMFDISDPANVQEAARLNLDEYYYSEALYNHHAILINPAVNLIGFEAEGSDEGDYWKEYLVFSYDDGSFVQKFKLNTKDEEGRYYTTRGTFIDETFYLLSGDGSVESYDLNTGEALGNLEVVSSEN